MMIGKILFQSSLYMKYFVYYVIILVITPVMTNSPLYTYEIPSRPAADHGAVPATGLC